MQHHKKQQCRAIIERGTKKWVPVSRKKLSANKKLEHSHGSIRRQNDLEWREGIIPVSTLFDDPYFSLDNGAEESEYVFIQGNGLAQKFAALTAYSSFHIAEMGFGTGLNFVTTWAYWDHYAPKNAHLHISAFELYPLEKADMAKSLSHWPRYRAYAEKLLSLWPEIKQKEQNITIELGHIHLHLYLGDARERVHDLISPQHAWYLDGFSPAKNPQLWEKSLMQAIYKHSIEGASLATYSAAGWVRQNLSEAGFHVERIKGYGRKKHMTIARKYT